MSFDLNKLKRVLDLPNDVFYKLQGDQLCDLYS